LFQGGVDDLSWGKNVCIRSKGWRKVLPGGDRRVLLARERKTIPRGEKRVSQRGKELVGPDKKKKGKDFASAQRSSRGGKSPACL